MLNEETLLIGAQSSYKSYCIDCCVCNWQKCKSITYPDK
jgi:hypothetical protein